MHLAAYFLSNSPCVLLPTTKLVPTKIHKKRVELAPLDKNEEADADKYINGAWFANSGLENGSIAYNRAQTEDFLKPISLPPVNAPVTLPKKD